MDLRRQETKKWTKSQPPIFMRPKAVFHQDESYLDDDGTF
jgi:hypothetical protein